MSKVRFRNKQLALRVISVRKPVTTNRAYVDDLSSENQYFYLWKMHREIGSKIMLAPMSKVRFRKKQLALCVTSFGVAACLLYQCCLTSTETVVTVGDWSWSSSFFTQLLNSESCSKHQFKGIHTHARINAYTRTRTRERARAHTHTHSHSLPSPSPSLSIARVCVCPTLRRWLWLSNPDCFIPHLHQSDCRVCLLTRGEPSMHKHERFDFIDHKFHKTVSVLFCFFSPFFFFFLFSLLDAPRGTRRDP